MHLDPDLSCIEDNCEYSKFDAGVESILKKDGGQKIRSLSGDHGTRQRRKEARFDNGDHRRSNGCDSSSRRVLFKNNVSVYRFDTEPPLLQNGNGSVSIGRPVRENEGRPNGPKEDTIVRPPTSLNSRDNSRRSTVHGQLNCSRRPAEKPVTDNSLSSSSIVIVGDFKVTKIYQYFVRICF